MTISLFLYSSPPPPPQYKCDTNNVTSVGLVVVYICIFMCMYQGGICLCDHYVLYHPCVLQPLPEDPPERTGDARLAELHRFSPGEEQRHHPGQRQWWILLRKSGNWGTLWGRKSWMLFK